MTRLRHRHAALAILVAALSAVVLAFSLPSGRSSGPSPAVNFSTIPAAKLAENGIILSVAHGATPSNASGQAAATAASNDLGGRAILEYHYAHCVDTQSAHVLNEDCWAVSLDPTGITSNPPPGQAAETASYALVFIDPSTEKLIEADEGG